MNTNEVMPLNIKQRRCYRFLAPRRNSPNLTSSLAAWKERLRASFDVSRPLSCCLVLCLSGCSADGVNVLFHIIGGATSDTSSLDLLDAPELAVAMDALPLASFEGPCGAAEAAAVSGVKATCRLCADPPNMLCEYASAAVDVVGTYVYWRSADNTG